MKNLPLPIKIAKEKRKENVAEYILYMWTIERMVSSYRGDRVKMRSTLVDPSVKTEEDRDSLFQWYWDIASALPDEDPSVGHIPEIECLMDRLESLHNSLLDNESESLYRSVYFGVLPSIISLRTKSGGKELGEIRTALIAVFGYYLLKLEEKIVSIETLEATKRIATFLAFLSDRFKTKEEVEGGDCDV